MEREYASSPKRRVKERQRGSLVLNSSSWQAVCNGQTQMSCLTASVRLNNHLGRVVCLPVGHFLCKRLETF